MVNRKRRRRFYLKPAAIHGCCLLLSLLVLLNITLPSARVTCDETQYIAKQRFQEGIALAMADNYDQALKAFESSFETNPKPIVLYNIGMCQKALDRRREAFLTFRQYLNEAGSSPNPDMRPQVREALADLKTSMSFLKIVGDTPNATLTIDNEVSMALPLDAPYPVYPGKHHIAVTAPEHSPFERSVETPLGETIRIDVMLSKALSMISINCNIGNEASIYIDGKPMGKCPYKNTLPTGSHQVQVRAPNRKTFFDTIQLPTGGHYRLDVTLTRLPHRTTNKSTNKKLGPPADSLGDMSQRDALKTNWNAAAISSFSLGMASFSLGLVFTVKGIRDNRRAEEIRDTFDGDPSNPDYKEFNDIRDNRIPLDRTLAIVGYCGAVLFSATGVALFMYHRHRNTRQGYSDSHNRFSITESDVRFHF
jgi:hypothetical protein